MSNESNESTGSTDPKVYIEWDGIYTYYHVYGPENFVAWLKLHPDAEVEGYHMSWEHAPTPDIRPPTSGWWGPLEECHVTRKGKCDKYYIHHQHQIFTQAFRNWVRSEDRQRIGSDYTWNLTIKDMLLPWS